MASLPVTYLRDDQFIKDYGNRVRSLRLELGVFQAQLAIDRNMEVRQISRIEKRFANTNISNAHFIAQAHKVTTSKLFEF